MVGWKDAHYRVRVDGLQDVCRQADRGGCVALGWLGQNLGLGDFGQLADDLGAEVIVGQNPDPFRGENRAQAIDGLLD